MSADPNCPICRGTGLAPTAMMGVTTPCDCVRGATGRFPNGKVREDDEGELQFQVRTAADGTVYFDFNKSVSWIALRPEQALELGALLIRKGKQLLEPPS